MKIFLTGICGFVGSALARALLEATPNLKIYRLDNFVRPGSERNRVALESLGIKVFHGDIRCGSDLEIIPPVDWVIDAAANRSVLAGADGKMSSRQLTEHNLFGSVVANKNTRFGPSPGPKPGTAWLRASDHSPS